MSQPGEVHSITMQSFTTTSRVGERRAEVQQEQAWKKEFLLSADSRDWEEPFCKLPAFKDTSTFKDPERGTTAGRLLEFLQKVRNTCFLSKLFPK